MRKLFVLIVKIEFLKKWNFLSQCAQIIPLVGQFTTKVGDVENMPVCHINKKGKIVFVRFPSFLVRKDLHTNMAWNPSEPDKKRVKLRCHLTLNVANGMHKPYMINAFYLVIFPLKRAVENWEKHLKKVPLS